MSGNILLIGYGNPGRQDDGLGPALIESLAHQKNIQDKVTLSSNYQLTVEDALDIAAYGTVIFVDASLAATPPFTFEPTVADTQQSLGSHQLLPESVLQLCQTLYDASPNAFTLAIRGYEFDQFEEALSHQAKENLDAALSFATEWVEQHA